jgi:hypothetical protein
LKNDLSVRDDRRGSYNLLFSPPNTSSLKKRNFPSVLLLAGKKKRKMFWLKQ